MGWEGEGPGPFQRRWQEIGGIKVLAVGAYGEVSDTVRELLAEAAEAGATRLWRRHGCRSEQEALSMVATALTARLGVAFVRAQAKLLRKRIHLAEPGGAQRARDRAENVSYAAHLADVGDYRYLNSWGSIPQYWRGGEVVEREQLQQNHMSSARLPAPQLRRGRGPE